MTSTDYAASALGPCPNCEGTLRPVLTLDGQAWDAEQCDKCSCKWTHQWPQSLATLDREIEKAKGRS